MASVTPCCSDLGKRAVDVQVAMPNYLHISNATTELRAEFMARMNPNPVRKSMALEYLTSAEDRPHMCSSNTSRHAHV